MIKNAPGILRLEFLEPNPDFPESGPIAWVGVDSYTQRHGSEWPVLTPDARSYKELEEYVTGLRNDLDRVLAEAQERLRRLPAG